MKPAAPKAPLWVLLIATEVLDVLCFGFDALGIEEFGISQTDIHQGVVILSPASIPWSHGLFMSAVWSFIAAAIAYLIYKDRRASAIIGLAIFSHWILDFIVHLPDLPLFFACSPLLGLGLWGSGPGLILSGILEFSLLAGGITIYLINRKRTSEALHP
ncbi:MAG: hypothetical protein JXB38_18060 [Anaerolineales bacterium]|nr:hypothetical protein [Anaerolineales bacterium]